MRLLPAFSVVLLLAAGSLPGCGGKLDEHSGGDHVRGKAVDIPLNDTHDDHVSADKGDHTDWKHFVLASPSMLTVNAYWDDPSVTAVVNVCDQFGGRIFELKHKSGERENHWKGIKLRDGEYYLEVVASRGTSVYTLEVTQAEREDDVHGDDSIGRPE